MPRSTRLVPAAVALLLLAGCGPIGRVPGEELCDALESDLQSAITASKDLPDVSDTEPMRYGTCSTTKTKRLDVNLPGLERHRAVTISGRLAMDGPGLNLQRLKGISKENAANQVTALPQLGRDAFVVLRTGAPQADDSASPVVAEPQNAGGAPGPASALTLPATAYWRHGKAVLSASATRDGATAEESMRATRRLAELLNRRPTQEQVG